MDDDDDVSAAAAAARLSAGTEAVRDVIDAYKSSMKETRKTEREEEEEEEVRCDGGRQEVRGFVETRR